MLVLLPVLLLVLFWDSEFLVELLQFVLLFWELFWLWFLLLFSVLIMSSILRFLRTRYLVHRLLWLFFLKLYGVFKFYCDFFLHLVQWGYGSFMEPGKEL